MWSVWVQKVIPDEAGNFGFGEEVPEVGCSSEATDELVAGEKQSGLVSGQYRPVVAYKVRD